MDNVEYRKILGLYPTGVCVVTSVEQEGTAIGMAVGSFTSVSLEPPLVAFFPDRSSSTWPRIRAIGRFCVNVLGEDQARICRAFATPGADKFAGISHRTSGLGLPIIDDVVAWIECMVHTIHEAGDHFIVVGEVSALGAERSIRPLIFHQRAYGRFDPVPAFT